MAIQYFTLLLVKQFMTGYEGFSLIESHPILVSCFPERTVLSQLWRNDFGTIKRGEKEIDFWMPLSCFWSQNLT